MVFSKVFGTMASGRRLSADWAPAVAACGLCHASVLRGDGEGNFAALGVCPRCGAVRVGVTGKWVLGEVVVREEEKADG